MLVTGRKEDGEARAKRDAKPVEGPAPPWACAVALLDHVFGAPRHGH